MKYWFVWVFMAVFLLCQPVAGWAQQYDHSGKDAKAAQVEQPPQSEKAADAAANAILPPINNIKNPYASWDEYAQRVENELQTKNVRQGTLDVLRQRLVGWRSYFNKQQDQNAQAIKTVNDQLTALGPKPKEGTEAPEVTQKRDDLNQQLADLEAPVKNASLAYSRADALIKSIDQAARERQTRRLLELGPSPLLPANWMLAAQTFLDVGKGLRDETVTLLHDQVARINIRNHAPVIGFMIILGLVLIFYVRPKIRPDFSKVTPDNATSKVWLTLFLQSFASFFLPYIGVLMLINAVRLNGLIGDMGFEILTMLQWAILVLIAIRWVTRFVFPPVYLREQTLQFSKEERRSGRRSGNLIAAVSGLFLLVQSFSGADRWTDEAHSVVVFPLILLGSFALWRQGLLLNRETKGVDIQEGERGFRVRVIRGASFVMMGFAFASPLLGAIGYINASEALLMPMLWTTALLGGILVLQEVAVELNILITGNSDTRESLFPVLTGFLLFMIALPVMALFWGARTQDLSEIWNMVVNGFTVGGINISPSVFVVLITVFVIGYALTRLLQGALQNTVLPRTRIDVGGQNAIVSGVGYVGVFLAAIMAINSAGIDLSSLAIVAGALSVGIGFGLQNIVSNFVSGIILLIERPISQGDWIEVGGHQGYVRRISVRSTRIETFDRTDVIVPNSDFVSGAVTNFTRGNTIGRLIAPVGVAYGTDTKRVAQILQEIAENHPMVLANPAPNVIFKGFGDSSLDFEIRAILRDVNWVMNVHSEMNHEIAQRFQEENIEIPFPQRDIWMRSDTAAAPPVPAKPETPSGSDPAIRSTVRTAEGPETDLNSDAPSGDTSQ